MNIDLKIQAYSEKGVLISWPNVIDEKVSRQLLAVKNHISKRFYDDLVDVSNGYQSLLLYFKHPLDTDMVTRIRNELAKIDLLEQQETSKTWKIPVCYDFEFGIDLDYFLSQKSIDLEHLIQQHTKPLYHVYCKGFLPGFLYLGGLDKKLHLKRKEVPSLRIPKNSVAIGGEQTGVYPSQSPGGWHIIGRTPVALFDIKTDFSNQIKIGDKVKFESITKQTFFELEQQNKPSNND